jgi:hypothetical protein
MRSVRKVKEGVTRQISSYHITHASHRLNFPYYLSPRRRCYQLFPSICRSKIPINPSVFRSWWCPYASQESNSNSNPSRRTEPPRRPFTHPRSVCQFTCPRHVEGQIVHFLDQRDVYIALGIPEPLFPSFVPPMTVVRQAFRKLVRFHPDRRHGLPKEEAAFMYSRITEVFS